MKKRLAGLWKNEFIRGGTLVTISFTIANFINLIDTFIAGRVLGPAGYGEMASLLSYVTIISVPASVIITVVTQKVSEADENAGKIALAIESLFWTTIRKYWYLAALAFLIVPFIPSLTNLSPLTSYFLLPIFWAMFLFLFYSAFLQGMRMFVLYALISVVSPIIKLIGPISALITPNKLFMVMLFLFLAFAIPFVWVYNSFKTYAKTSKFSVTRIEKSIRHIIFEKNFIIITIAILSTTLLNNFDIIYVKKMFTAEQAGIYSSWALLSKILLYATGPITTVAFVFFASKKNSDNYKKPFFFSALIILCIGIANLLLYLMFGSYIINFLFGDTYSEVLPYLSYASIFGTLYALINFVNTFFLARKSMGALILPPMYVVYIACLMTFGKSLEDIMKINIYFSISVLVLFVAYMLKPRKI